MSYRTFTLRANKPVQVPVVGKMILIDSTGDAEGIDITPMRGGQELPTMPGRKKAFKCWVEYDALTLQASVNCTVALFLSMTDVSLGFADGSLMNVRGAVSIENDPDNRVPVDISGGVITVTADNVGVSNGNENPIPVQRQSLSTIVDMPPVVVGAATIAQQLVSDPTMKRIRVRNGHETAVIAIGGAGVTLANAAIRLTPGDVWLEDDAPGADWYVVSDTVGAIAQIQGVK